jgi:cbb3-type cytochrome c oxidase subunit II
VAATAVVLLAAFCAERFVVAVHTAPQLTQVERGRQVYISEGCINCHSQFVRPNTADVMMWGPSESMEELRRERPPLIGNRRQGPDLAEVGGRRSPLWLRAHFFDPHEVSGGSIMPSYAYLFLDRRGNDLLTYIESLQGSGTAEHLAAERGWHLPASAMAAANAGEGERLFQRHCATCHSADGQTRLIWQANFKRLPPDLRVGPFFYLPPYGPTEQRMDRLAQIVKFGVAGTDMAGHEYLPDNEIASISLWLSQSNAQLSQNQSFPMDTGEKP